MRASIMRDVQREQRGRSIEVRDGPKGKYSGPRLSHNKALKIVRMDSKANFALHDVKGLQFRRR